MMKTNEILFSNYKKKIIIHHQEKVKEKRRKIHHENCNYNKYEI